MTEREQETTSGVARDDETPDDASVHRSSRDPEEIKRGLERWLAERVSHDVTIGAISATDTNGMSSETMLFDATWTDGARPVRRDLVARIAPEVVDIPVFPTYDLEEQFRVIEGVARLSAVPVPEVWWYEAGTEALGSPFFVMSRVDGDVPPDVLPYNFGESWLYHATPQQQRRLQDMSVGALVELHGIDNPESEFEFLVDDDRSGSPLRRKVDRARDWYEWVVDGGERAPVIDAGFAWMEEHWPSDEGPTVLNWGDSRIGNVLYRDFVPVAVLDWEMACLCPRELDVAWMVYAHDVFEDIASDLDMPRMPEFLRLGDVVDVYEAASGVRLANLQFFTVLAAVQYAIVFLRTGQRRVHFGEIEAPQRLEDLLMNRRGLERAMSDDWDERSRA